MAKRFLTINETADLLTVSPSTIRRRISEGSILVHRVGCHIRIDVRDLERFVDGCREVSGQR